MATGGSYDDYFAELGRRLRDDALRREGELSNPRQLLLRVWEDLEGERKFLSAQRQEVAEELGQVRVAHREVLLRDVWVKTYEESEQERVEGRRWRRATVGAWVLLVGYLLLSASKLDAGLPIWPLQQALVMHAGLGLAVLAGPAYCHQNAARHFQRLEKLQDEWLSLQRTIDVVRSVSPDQVHLISVLNPPTDEPKASDPERGAEKTSVVKAVADVVATARTFVSRSPSDTGQ